MAAIDQAVARRARPARYGRRWQVTRSSAAMASSISGATTSTRRRHSTSPADLRRGHPAAADHQARLAGQHEVDRVERAVYRHRADVATGMAADVATGIGVGGRGGFGDRRSARPLLLVEAQDLQLDGQVDLAQRAPRAAPR